MLNLRGKRGLIMGVANERSIAWGIAKAMSDAGAKLAFTYQGETFGRRLQPLAESVGANLMLDVDVTNDDSFDKAFGQLQRRSGRAYCLLWPFLRLVSGINLGSN